MEGIDRDTLTSLIQVNASSLGLFLDNFGNIAGAFLIQCATLYVYAKGEFQCHFRWSPDAIVCVSRHREIFPANNCYLTTDRQTIVWLT